MATYARHDYQPLAESVDFSIHDTILDVGGGTGELAFALLRALPRPYRYGHGPARGGRAGRGAGRCCGPLPVCCGRLLLPVAGQRRCRGAGPGAPRLAGCRCGADPGTSAGGDVRGAVCCTWWRLVLADDSSGAGRPAGPAYAGDGPGHGTHQGTIQGLAGRRRVCPARRGGNRLRKFRYTGQGGLNLSIAAASIVERLALAPHQDDVAIILRHAEREYIPAGTFGAEVSSDCPRRLYCGEAGLGSGAEGPGKYYFQPGAALRADRRGHPARRRTSRSNYVRLAAGRPWPLCREMPKKAANCSSRSALLEIVRRQLSG